jgi:hypothetical protein
MQSRIMFSLMYVTVCIVAPVLGCDFSGRVDEFVVPNDFRGAIKIEGNVPDGDEEKRDAESGKYVYVIPESGLIRLQGAGPFTKFETREARFADGTQLVQDIQTTPDPNGIVEHVIDPERTIVLWALGRRVNSLALWYYVGTKAEYDNALILRGDADGLAAGKRVPPLRKIVDAD